MPPRALGRDGDRLVELCLLATTLYAKTVDDLWDRVHEGGSIEACKAFAHTRFGTNDEDWSEVSLTVEDMMKAYALDAITAARDAFGIHLDLSTSSLKAVEQILGKLFDSQPRGWRKLLQKKQARLDLDTLPKIWGGYIGEVIRRHHGGEWRIAKDLYPDDVVYALRVGTLDMFPPAKVYKRLTNGAEDDVWFYYKVLDERLIKKQA